MDLNDINDILKEVPDYQTFLTVDELKASTKRLAEKYPEIVEVIQIGHSRARDSIEAVKIGSGSQTGLIFAMPHPNEPIGSMMLEYFSTRLAEDDNLRNALDFTWYLIKCVDPDGTRLNEGWFKGPFTITNYAGDYYRPPSHLQVEWTFPIEYKELKFSTPLPETQALMNLIEGVHPDLIYSLHNAGFGGVYFYISEDNETLRSSFYDLVNQQGLNLHLGEAEAPWMTKFADAIFLAPSITQAYDFLEAQGADPGMGITGGTCSWDYAARFCDPFSLLCEMPYFQNSIVHDISESESSRRDVILQGYKKIEEQFQSIIDVFDMVEGELSTPSPFKNAIENFVQVIPQNLAAMMNWAKTDPKTEATATNAEKFDSLYVKRFYFVFLNLGMTIRMIEYQIASTGSTLALSKALENATKAFNDISSELENQMEYSVVPIQKLVQVQLGSALLSAFYAATRN